MNYTHITLFLLGILGILLHNLVELNKLNKSNPGTMKLSTYLKAEVYAILIAIIMVIVAIFIKSEIQQLEAAGKWLGLAFVAIGYMGQSLLIFVMGRANKIIDKAE